MATTYLRDNVARPDHGRSAAPRVSLHFFIQRIMLANVFVLLALPGFLGMAQTRFFGIITLIIAIGHYFLFCRAPHNRLAGYSQLAIPAALAMVVAISIFRANDPDMPLTARVGLIASFMLFAIWMVLLFSDRDPARRTLFLQSFLLAAPLYVTLNFIWYFVFGAPVPADGVGAGYVVQNDLLAPFGIYIPRLEQFHALAGGNTASNFAAFGLVSLLYLYNGSRSRLWRAVLLGFGAASLGVLILGGGRGSIFGAVIVIVAMRFLNIKALRRATLGALAFALVSAPVVGGVFKALDSSTFSDLLIRVSDVQNLGVGTGRVYVWDAALDELSKPSPAHFFGWGMKSADTSGVVVRYDWLFGSESGHTLHNTSLQWIFDTGYLGLILWTLASAGAILAVGRPSAFPEPQAKLLLTTTLLILILGLSDAAGTIYGLELFIVWLGSIVIAAVGTEMIPSKRVGQLRMRRA